MKIAIVHDWLTNFAGAERVVYELHRLYPKAPIYTSVYNPEAIAKRAGGENPFAEADVRTSFIQKLPLARTHHQLFPLLRRRAFARFDFSEYDIVISSSGAEAKSIRTPGKTIHICYCHAPTHYYWSRYQAYLQHRTFGFVDMAAKLYLKATIKRSRRWDYLAAQQPDVMVANSSHIAREIGKYYNRDATVIHPPVDLDRFTVNNSDRNGFVIVGRQTHYKRIDLAVQACTNLNRQLVVIGNGPQHEYLQSIAGPSVKFITEATDADVAELVAQAEAFIFPGVDDFGIAPVEALASGTPVIAYKKGGALDYINAETGIFFTKPTVNSLAAALDDFDLSAFKPVDVAKYAQQFTGEVFRKKISALVDAQLKAR